ncbi:MAG TPA: hypothetical protein VGH39_10745 [Xanthobacteraceae bacterium]|jgi:hypothetical protein
MAVAVIEKKLKTFQATMLVTRMEEWCVEAASADEARELLASGSGHRCHLGDCVQVEVERVDAEV